MNFDNYEYSQWNVLDIRSSTQFDWCDEATWSHAPSLHRTRDDGGGVSIQCCIFKTKSCTNGFPHSCYTGHMSWDVHSLHQCILFCATINGNCFTSWFEIREVRPKCIFLFMHVFFTTSVYILILNLSITSRIVLRWCLSLLLYIPT